MRIISKTSKNVVIAVAANVFTIVALTTSLREFRRITVAAADIICLELSKPFLENREADKFFVSAKVSLESTALFGKDL